MGRIHVRQLVHGNPRMVWCFFNLDFGYPLICPIIFTESRVMGPGVSPPFAVSALYVSRRYPKTPDTVTTNGVEHIYSGPLLGCVLFRVSRERSNLMLNVERLPTARVVCGGRVFYFSTEPSPRSGRRTQSPMATLSNSLTSRSANLARPSPGQRTTARAFSPCMQQGLWNTFRLPHLWPLRISRVAREARGLTSAPPQGTLQTQTANPAKNPQRPNPRVMRRYAPLYLGQNIHLDKAHR